MCRFLGYLGNQIQLNKLLYLPDNSLVTQAYDAEDMEYLNLAGFGFAGWNKESDFPDDAFLYKSIELPMYDENLIHLSSKLNIDCLVAHVRGAKYIRTSQSNNRRDLHPFIFHDSPIAMAHNGNIFGFDNIKIEMMKYISDKILMKCEGLTDSEYFYALFLSQLKDYDAYLDWNSAYAALSDTLEILKKIRKKYNIKNASGLNIILTDGHSIMSLRYKMDFGYYKYETFNNVVDYGSLWFNMGNNYGNYNNTWLMKGDLDSANSVIIASEPLSKNSTQWLQIPEYTCMYFNRSNSKLTVNIGLVDV